MLLRARRLGLSAQVIEAASGVGGTWYHNRYPGARVDVQSLEYSFSFDEALQQDWQWTERYAAQPELLRYANHVADRFGLRDGILLDTRLEAAQWDEASARWQARASTGDRWQARFLVMATGPLSTTNLPRFPGLDRFRGRSFHTGRWPHEPVDFTGERVAVIGTGSSAVQSIPIIAAQAAELTVFQRTPAYSVPARNGPLDPAHAARIKADYAGFRARNRLMPGALGSEMPASKVSVFDATPQEREAAFEARWQRGGFGLMGAFSDLMLSEQANAFAADFVRRKIAQTVRDPDTARRLMPSYPIGCKRLCVDTGYYETYNRPNVHLVDVSQAPIDAITPRGVSTGGREVEVDSIVFATGFDAMTGTLMRIDLRGRDGATIQQAWRDAPQNYLGIGVSGFPNLFNLAGPGSASVLTNVLVSIEHHVEWVSDCIAWMDAHGHRTIDPTPQAQAAWGEHVHALAERTVYLSCNSWYLGANIPGKPRRFMSLIGFPPYAERCAQVAANGYEGFALA
jgi:cyclohexanone monooxygenase